MPQDRRCCWRRSLHNLTGLAPAEALQDAIERSHSPRCRSFRIVTCMPGEGSVKDNPVMRFLEKLKQLQSELKNVDDIDELVECLKELSSLCSSEGS